MEQTECSETSAYKIQMPGNYPEENIQQVCNLFCFPEDKTVILFMYCALYINLPLNSIHVADL